MTQTDHQTTAPMGTLAWGDGNDGTLRQTETFRLIGNLAYVQIREISDNLRERLGLLRPQEIALDELLPPQTALVQDALGLAEQTHEQALLFHSWRTYFFGAMLASYEGIKYDPSLFFASAILHDLGLTEGHTPQLCECCFAVSGGHRARRYLKSKGHSEEASEQVGNAIALHLNGWVSKRKHGAEAHLVSRGAVCDLFGAGRRRLPRNNLREILVRYPRDGVIDALQFETAEHRKGTRPAVMTKLAGGKAPRDPFRAEITIPRPLTAVAKPLTLPPMSRSSAQTPTNRRYAEDDQHN